MPAAIQKFTLADRAKKEARRAALEEMKENPPPVAPGQEYFTAKMNEEKERKRAELQALRENPPPASVATEYFNKLHAQRQEELVAMANEPAPPAIEYFTQMAREEKSKRDLMLKEMNDKPVEPSAATKHFAEKEAEKKMEIEEARAAIRKKVLEGSSSRALVNWAELTQQKAPTVPAY